MEVGSVGEVVIDWHIGLLSKDVNFQHIKGPKVFLEDENLRCRYSDIAKVVASESFNRER